MRCCQRATAKEIAEDPERYDCSRCEWNQQISRLWRENIEAWRIHQLLNRRIVVDGRLTASVFERLTDGWLADDVRDLIERLDLIRETLERPVGRASA